MAHCCLTLTRYLPWWSVIGFLLGYELYAVLFHKQTLSQQVWKASKRWRWLPWVVIPFVAALVLHFWFGFLAPRNEATPFPGDQWEDVV